MKQIKNHLLNSLSLALAALTLVVSFNWSVNVHYCGTEIINYSFVGEAEGCGMEEFDLVCETTSNGDGISKTCCSNQDLVFESENQVRKFSSFKSLKLLDKVFASKENTVKLTSNCSETRPYSTSPPFSNQPNYRLSLYQVYLI